MTATTRRAYGTGSISWSKAGKCWVARVNLPRAPGGRRRSKSFVSKSREDVEAQLAAYLEEHPPREYLGRAEYMARARALGTHTPAQWWRMVRDAGRRCHYCGIVADVSWTPRSHPRHLAKDHRTPVSRGGSDSLDNIAVACFGCNREKGLMTEPEYLTWKAGAWD